MLHSAWVGRRAHSGTEQGRPGRRAAHRSNGRALLPAAAARLPAPVQLARDLGSAISRATALRAAPPAASASQRRQVQLRHVPPAQPPPAPPAATRTPPARLAARCQQLIWPGRRGGGGGAGARCSRDGAAPSGGDCGARDTPAALEGAAAGGPPGSKKGVGAAVKAPVCGAEDHSRA
eukprot:354239-Chlamydomonas_euryale.AAC.10